MKELERVHFWPFAVGIGGSVSVVLIVIAFMMKMQWPKMKGRDPHRANRAFDNHLAEAEDRSTAAADADRRD